MTRTGTSSPLDLLLLFHPKTTADLEKSTIIFVASHHIAIDQIELIVTTTIAQKRITELIYTPYIYIYIKEERGGDRELSKEAR
jgi:hypothetical protein